MKFAKSILMGTGSFVLAGLILALLAPKAAHAVVAAAVQVVNTTSSPVLNLDIERNARIPYQSTVFQQCPTNICTFTPTPAPAGFRLVVQNVSGSLALPSGSTPPVGTLFNRGPDFVEMGLTGGAVGLNNNAAFNQAVTAYFDPGDSFQVIVSANFFPLANTFQAVTVTGYLQNCSLSACPAIQQ